MSIVLANPASRMQLSVGITHNLLRGVLNHQPAEGNPAIGSSTGQIQKIYNADFTVPGTGTNVRSLDLSTVLDPSGAAFNPSKVTHILIENLSTVAGEDFTIGGGSNPLFAESPIIVQAVGGRQMIENPGAGITVDGTHKVLQIALAAGSGVSGRVTVWGR